MALFAWVGGARGRARTKEQDEAHHDEPLVHDHVARVLARDKYLLLIAGLTLLLNWVRSNGDYLLDRTLLAALADAKAHGVDPSTFVTSFKADYFEWVNITGVVLQLFAVSRVMSRFGVRNALLVLPAVAFLEYGTYLVAPILSVFMVVEGGRELARVLAPEHGAAGALPRQLARREVRRARRWSTRSSCARATR